MNLKDNKGITTIDITMSLIIIAFFITIITVISGNIQNNSKSLKRETEALYYAVSTIENIKSQSFNVLPQIGNDKIVGIAELVDGYIKDTNGNDTPYYRTIIVEDYAEKNSDKQAEILKKVTVQIAYKDKNKQKDITLSTIKTRIY